MYVDATFKSIPATERRLEEIRQYKNEDAFQETQNVLSNRVVS